MKRNVNEESKVFWIGEQPGTRMFPGPVPANLTHEEYLLSEGRVFTINGELDYILEKFGRYGSCYFRVYENKELIELAYLDFDVLLLLHNYPDQIVETNRADEHFFYRALWSDETVEFQQWGTQGESNVTLKREEFAFIIQEIMKLPDLEEGIREANSKKEIAIISRPAEECDRPDWCDDCGHPKDKCECDCWSCEKPVRECICEKKQGTERPAFSEDGRRLDWYGNVLPPLHFENNKLDHHFILSKDQPVFTAYPFDSHGYGEWFEASLTLYEYQKAQRVSGIHLWIKVFDDLKNIVPGTTGEYIHSIFNRREDTIDAKWNEEGISLQTNCRICEDETGIITLPWNVWKVLMESLPEFKLHHAEQKVLHEQILLERKKKNG